MVLYPILFGVAGPLSLLGENIEMVQPSNATRSVLFLFAMGSVLLLLLRRALGDIERAAVGSIGLLALGLGYGHVAQALTGSPEAGKPFALHAFLTSVWIAAAAGLWVVLHRVRRFPTTLHGFLFLASLALLLQPVGRILAHEAQANDPWPPLAGQLAPLGVPVSSLNRSRPDIFMLVLDGYGRADVLSELYGLDNEEFLESLRSRGFLVANGARGNYPQTTLSLASALNFVYVNELAATEAGDRSQRAVSRMIRFNDAARILQSLGYRVATVATGYRRTELIDSDVFLEADVPGLTPFESLFLETSLLSPWIDLSVRGRLLSEYPGYSYHRRFVAQSLDHVASLSEIPGPTFVFAHILIPHPPFVFGPQGEPTALAAPFRTGDGDQFPGRIEDYRNGYRDQLQYANEVGLVLIDKILDDAPEAVIVLFGDHGPGSSLNWADLEQTNLRERMSILYAIRLPGLRASDLPVDASPVNSFRIIFNHLFAGSYPQLPNRSYFSSWQAPYDFVPVDEEILEPPS
jgi:hypothetical protein